MELVFVLSIFLQQIGKSKKSATRRHLVQNPRIPTWTSTTHLQVRKIGNANLLQMHKTCQELSGNSRQNLSSSVPRYIRVDPKDKEKNPIPSNLNRHTCMPKHSRKRTLVPFDAPSQKSTNKNTQDECFHFCRPSGRRHL